MNDIDYMREAYIEAQLNVHGEEYPVGAVLVVDDDIVSRSRNSVYEGFDPTAHAEINVIRSACKILKTTKLDNSILYTTLYPCPLCEAAIVEARVSRVVYGSEAFAWIKEVKYKERQIAYSGPVLGEECKQIFVDKLNEKGRTDILEYVGT